MRSRSFALFCAVLLLFTGCASNDPMEGFFTGSKLKYETVENVVIETEFSEYPGYTTQIAVNITNNSGDDFLYDHIFQLQKEDNGKWRDLINSGTYVLQQMTVPANSTGRHTVFLKGHFPYLPDGNYRIGIGTAEPSKYAWGEFAVKTTIETVENVIIEPEFPEYPPDTEMIYVTIINNSDKKFYRGTDFWLQKKENGEWRDVRSDKNIHDMLVMEIPGKSTNEKNSVSLYGFPKPLPEGEYRIGLGCGHEVAWGEFMIKEPEGDDT